MSVTQINVDDDALDQVMALTHAKTKREAVNLALHYYVERQERAARIGRHFDRARLGGGGGRGAAASAGEGRPVIYLLDTSGLVRLLGDSKLQSAWFDAIDAEAIGSCYPQRAEFLYSSRNGQESDEIIEMFTDLYPDVSVPKDLRFCMTIRRPSNTLSRTRHCPAGFKASLAAGSAQPRRGQGR
jgi:Bacterial antitoxin of type II TA system, VapB